MPLCLLSQSASNLPGRNGSLDRSVRSVVLHSARRPRGLAPRCALNGGGSDLWEARKVLVLPGYLIDSQEMVPLVESLRRRGFNAALPPVRWHNWVPTVGGRSLRPILDRINFVLDEFARGAEVGPENGYEIPLPEDANLYDRLAEFRDPSMGNMPPLPAPERGEYTEKVAILASSASGWITRIMLGSGPEYCGRVYHGSDRVDRLVTLGAPHFCNGKGVSRKNLDFVNTHYPGAHHPHIRYACVAGKAKKGEKALIPDFTYQSYELCAESGDVWGDGVIPVESALNLDGAETLLLEDVWHLPGDAKDGRVWYGSEEVIDSWVKYLE
ncbi:hypothetical protein BSKO_03899 [Bryopsis sp. KO-2023]|nr:hypothetical protein BSKO_03899 [Bryopsis sp. KO-2023]